MGKQQPNELSKSSQTLPKIKKNIRKDEVNEKDNLLKNQEDAEQLCCICYSSFSNQEIGIIQNCMHKFCFQCIKQWAQQKLTCPQCRGDFTQVTRIQNEGKLLIQKTHTFKKLNQDDDLQINLLLMEQLSQILFLLSNIDSEDEIN